MNLEMFHWHLCRLLMCTITQKNTLLLKLKAENKQLRPSKTLNQLQVGI